jgi:UDP-N-acetylglucosamine 2-epimerase (non-hydrolysing)
MIDSLLQHRSRAVPPAAGLPKKFGFVTLHRPSNVDHPEALAESLAILRAVSEIVPLVCALHPRTVASMASFGLKLESDDITVLPPQGYLETLGLMSAATLVLTDSGGMQEETTALGVPCLTLRENTERPITIEQGTNTLVGRDRARAVRLAEQIVASGGKRGRAPELWDGRAAGRIAAHLAGWLVERREPLHA